MKHKLLFVTYKDDHEEEGLSYVIKLAKTLNKNLTIFLLWKGRLSKKIESVLTAATFAEADEHETARQIVTEVSDPKLEPFIGKCHESGIEVDVQASQQDVFPTLKNYFKSRNGVDIVLIGPNVAETGSMKTGEIKRLAKIISRPIVTIAR